MPAKSSILVSLQPLARSVHLTSFQLQGSTKTPLRGTKGRLVRLRTMERARDRTPPWVAPLDARPRGAPPSPSYTEKPDGGGKVPGSRERGRGRGRDDSECLLATPTTPALVRDQARIRSVHRRAVRPVCVWCGVMLAVVCVGFNNGRSAFVSVSSSMAPHRLRLSDACTSLGPFAARRRSLTRYSRGTR